MDLNYYLVLKNHPELLQFLLWLVGQAENNKKLLKLLRASPLVLALERVLRGYVGSNLHFFQFQILDNSGFAEDIAGFEVLFEDCDQVSRMQADLRAKRDDVLEVLGYVEQVMAFVVFENYTVIDDIHGDFLNVANMLQRNKLLDFQFTERLRAVAKNRCSIRLLESEIFQKEFSLHLARGRFEEILRSMFGSDREDSKSSREEFDSETLDFLLLLSGKSTEVEAPVEAPKLTLEIFWEIMVKTERSYLQNLNAMSKKSELLLSMAEVDFVMCNADRAKEERVTRNSGAIKLETLKQAFENYSLVRNLSNIYKYFEDFVKKMEFDFQDSLRGLKEIAERSGNRDSNFFELVNAALDTDTRVRHFCAQESVMYRFIENNLTVWKGGLTRRI